MAAGEVASPPRWSFRTLSPVKVDSPIVRLGDVVEPVGGTVSAWPRLRRAAIGLVPLDATPMVIQRDRLAEAIRSAEGTSQAIDWLGVKEIEVVYRPTAGAEQPAVAQQHSPVRSAGGEQPAASYPVTAGAASPENDASPQHTASRPSLEATTADRLVYWIKSALRRQHPNVDAQYSVQIDPQQAALARLEAAQGIEQVTLLSPLREGAGQLKVSSRGAAGAAEATIEVRLKAYPKVAVASDSFRRGHRLTAGDVVLKPWPEDRWDESFVTDVESLIGMEVRSSLRSDRPISRSDVGPPIVIHRGDLLEVRVVGRGITVTTDATALGDAAVGDLLQVQIVSPRKKLVTRAVASGRVEIVTRAPQVPR